MDKRLHALKMRLVFLGRYLRSPFNPFLRTTRPGHFHSPIPDMKFIERNQARLFDRSIQSIDGIENHLEDQLALMQKLAHYCEELPFAADKTAGFRYYFHNDYFSYGDAIALFGMLRHFRPQRIIEVGSGFSSALMLDVNEHFFQNGMALTFIEPYPKRLLSLLNEEDKKRNEIIKDAVQNVPVEKFEALQPNDILFIDSSHVAKIGSDVVYLVTNVLPRLNDGVIVHFHDVFWPFEYPELWVREGTAWNEAYMLKAFLQFNTRFKIIFFNSYLATHHNALLAESIPSFMKNTGGSLWIQRTS